jgi:hypothetical protein
MSRRKSLAEREPNGRIQRVAAFPVSEVRRLRDAAMSGMRDPMWGTELGRLHLSNKITAAQFAAGKQWAEYASKYHQALCSPSPDPKAISLESMKGEALDPESSEGRKEARRHERAVASLVDAMGALKTTLGASERILRAICERNEMVVGHYELLSLVCGLNALANFWGLTPTRKSDVR